FRPEAAPRLERNAGDVAVAQTVDRGLLVRRRPRGDRDRAEDRERERDDRAVGDVTLGLAAAQRRHLDRVGPIADRDDARSVADARRESRGQRLRELVVAATDLEELFRVVADGV